LIASFHCAAEFENPIITTSRSGRLGSGGVTALNLFEAIKEIVPIYNVKLDVGNAQALADVFAWLNRPGAAPEDRSLMMDDILAQLRYKADRLPDEALRLIQEFLLETKDRLSQMMYDLRMHETKIDPNTIAEMQDKEAQIVEAIERLRVKVGHVERTGRFQLVGGVPPGAYSVPNLESRGEQRHEVSKDSLLELIQKELQPLRGPQAESRKVHLGLQQGPSMKPDHAREFAAG